MKPVLIDLFAGRMGWSKPFVDMGWHVVAIDLVLPDMEIPAGVDYVLRDILAMTADDLLAYNPSFITCSSPCEQFSVHGLKCFHPNPKYPEMGMRLFQHSERILAQLGVPYIMENVRSAEKFVGKAVNHCGPFYLWGNSVPAIFPRHAYQVTKGTKFGLDKDGTRNTRKLEDQYYRTGSSSKARRAHTAAVAAIPEPVARTVAELAASIVRMECVA